MDQVKIGKFIAQRRKAAGLTQLQLADKLGITDRAVSKWERGMTMPDSSIMLALCETLNITVNDLLSGEVVTVENYNKEMEKTLLDMVKQKEEADKRLLTVEIVMGVVTMVLFLALMMIAAYLEMPDWLRITIISVSTVLMFIMCFAGIRIEQVAGYYQCGKCGHKYVPTYSSVLWAMHMGTTRYMRCPKCDKRSWQKKVIRKD